MSTQLNLWLPEKVFKGGLPLNCMAYRKASLLIVAAAALFATNGLYVRTLNLPLEATLAGRLLFGALALFLYFTWQGKSLKVKSWRGAKLLAGAAALNALAFYTNFAAYALTTIATATVLLYTSPVFSALLEKYVFKEEEITRNNWIAVLLGLVGVGAIAWGQGLGSGLGQNLALNAGLVMGLASGITYALTFIATKKSIQTNGYEQTAFYYVLLAGLLFLPFAVLSKPVLTPEKVGLLALFGVLNSFIGVTLLLKGLKKVKPHHGIILVSTEMVFAAVYATLWLAEPLTLPVLAGGALIALAAYVAEKKG